MKIAMLDPSGFGLLYDQQLCDALGRRGHEVRLFSRPLRDGESSPSPAHTHIPIYYAVAERLRRRGSLRLAYEVIKGVEHFVCNSRVQAELTEWAPDVIHFQWLILPIADRWLLAKLRRIALLVLTVHDTTPHHGNPISRLQLWKWSDTMAQFDRLIVHTAFSKRQLGSAGIPIEQIEIIAHGVPELHRIGKEPYKAGHVAVDEWDQYLLFFGAIQPYKGVDVLIRAFALLPQHLQRKTRLLIAGKPYMSASHLKELGDALGVGQRITWDLRFIPDSEIHPLFERAEMVLFPYRNIDSSGALMIALQHGKPVIGTRVGGFADIIEDGVHGYLIPPEDPSSLAQAIQRLLEKPKLARALGANALHLAQALPTWDQIARQTEQVYHKLTAEGSNRP